MVNHLRCRACATPLQTIFVDLGMSPLANSYLSEDDLLSMEPFYPLSTYVCDNCLLVQLPMFASPGKIFSEYSYFSSTSTSWLAHCKSYADKMMVLLELDDSDLVVEVASNDGYLLRNFVEKSIPVLGIEPAANVAEVAEQYGVPTVVGFFGSQLARDLTDRKARLLIGNNVLAHVPDLHDFVEGLSLLLDRSGVLTMEFPHLLRLVEGLQFDTIYHEHFSYFSLNVVRSVFTQHGLDIVRAEELSTHGGSIRIYATHSEASILHPNGSVEALLKAEDDAGLSEMSTFLSFALEVLREKHRIIETITSIKEAGKQLIGYGAPAKANTLLNYCHFGRDVLPMTVDANPHKQGKFLPGSHVPIHEPSRIIEVDPDVIWILPWNLRIEIEETLKDLGWSGELLVRNPGAGLGG